MKRYFLIVLALCLSVGVSDLSAQSFLKTLGKTVKKEVVDRAKKETKKESKVTSSSKQNTEEKHQSQSGKEQKSSFEASKERHLRILEERGEIVRPKVVENSVKSTGPATGKTNGHEWVDLGLPSGTRWATCNIGATQPQQAGSHFAWGEVATKASYTEGNSKTNGKSMNDISGNATYDVATAKWGKGWRMPTKEEFAELIEYCTPPVYERNNGRLGQTITYPKTGRSIFLPATGHKDGAKVQEANGCGNYWTSTPQSDSYNNGAHEYHFGAALGEMGQGARYYGFAVRAVVDNTDMINVPSQGQTGGNKWVDLGLPSGNKWATCNLGAKSSEEFGNIYQWAKTTPKTGERRPKNENTGKNMNSISGDKIYDAASAQWGSTWKMPTKADFQELLQHCTWEYTTLGRVKGLKATSKKNGNYIFFPIKSNETIAEYWSATPSASSDNYSAETFLMNKDMVGPSSKERYNAYPIRPITQ